MDLVSQLSETKQEITSSAWQLSLLGAWQLSRFDEMVDVGVNARRLLAVLALRGACDRSYVAGLMWPNCPDSHAQGNLRATLSRFCRRQSDVLRVFNGTLALRDTVTVDVRGLVATAALISDGNVPAPHRATLRTLSAKDLLLGWSDEWVQIDRERLRQRRLHALEELSRRLVAAGDVATGLEAALEAVFTDPLRESAHRAVICAHLAEGNRAEALRQFTVLRQLLRNELGVEPSTLVTEMFS
jgi:DNA-binding SARP family transcriptional activator